MRDEAALVHEVEDEARAGAAVEDGLDAALAREEQGRGDGRRDDQRTARELRRRRRVRMPADDADHLWMALDERCQPAGVAKPDRVDQGTSEHDGDVMHRQEKLPLAPGALRMSEALVVNGVPVLPAGTGLRGTVVDVKKAGRFQKAARLGVRFDTVAAEGGAIRVQTEPIRWEMKSEKKGNWFIVGAGAAIGTVVGAIAGGGGGAAKGAAIGGAGGAGYVFATEGRNIRVKAGAPLTITLTQPLSRPAR